MSPICTAPFLRSTRFALLGLGVVALLAGRAQANTMEQWPTIQHTLSEHCYECHGGKKTKGGIDLKRLSEDPNLGQEFELWNKVKKSIAEGDMPPDEKPELSDDVKKQLTGWLGDSLAETLRMHAGEPGTVTMRRLTNAEYDRTVRDLTGVDLNLSKDFQPDGGGGEGFSNIGDVLFVSPQQLEKYLGAARTLADHATVMPGTGITFQEQRVGLRGPEQVKAQAEQALYVWYQKAVADHVPKDDEDMREGAYLLACWKWKFHEQTGAKSLEALAEADHLSPAFLQNWWDLVNNTKLKSRFLALTTDPWRALPGPDAAQPQAVPEVVTKTVAEIEKQRKSWYIKNKYLGHIQRMQQDADGIHPYPFMTEVRGQNTVHLVLGDCGDGAKGDLVVFDQFSMVRKGKKPEGYLPWLTSRRDAERADLKKAEETNADPAVLADFAARLKADDDLLAKFGKHPLGHAITPEAIALQAPIVVDFPVPDDATFFRGQGKLDLENPDAEFATAQWEATADAAPDPTKILPGMLTIWKRQTHAAGATMQDFSLMKAVFPDEYNRRLEEVARNYERGGHGPGVYYYSDEQISALISKPEQEHLRQMLEDWAMVRVSKPSAQQTSAWDEKACQHLEEFSALAWRRPLSPEEKTALRALFTAGRQQGLEAEPAVREAMLRVLVSPNFIFKAEDASQPGEQPLTAWELATRLSYFLWATMPDAELRAAAADGSLLKPEVLDREVRRMVHDPRVSALAQDFAGQWLEYDGFAKHQGVDTAKFPQFTPELRQDLNRETLTTVTYVLQNDRPVGELLTGDYTFLNERLASFYGVPDVKGDELRKVAVSQYHRGGLLGQGSILTKTSFPERTSPVNRGNWLLRTILGTPTPPPPNDVPKLKDHAVGNMTLRALLEQHRENAACAACHARIDPLGFTLDSFDPIGRWRTSDEQGRPIDCSGQMKDGTRLDGVDGLRQYLGAHEQQFDRLLCRKLLGFALGRNVLLTDQPLLEKMLHDLQNGGGKFSTVALAVAESRQFQHRQNN